MDTPITEQWKQWRKRYDTEMKLQNEKTLAAIKDVHRNGPISTDRMNIRANEMPIGRVPRYEIDCPRLSPSGNLIGWYPPGQHVGKPVHLSAIGRITEQFLNKVRFSLFYDENGATPQNRGRLNPRGHRESSTASQIVKQFREIAPDSKVPRGLPRKLASQFNCDANYVRRILRKAVLGTTA